MDVNIGYARGQLERARRTAAEHADTDVRARALDTVARWERVIAGMQNGTLDVGSRTPTGAPAWVTLDVVTGGFATGGHAAGGGLRDHERVLAAQRQLPVARGALNLHFLTAPDASEMLASGCYRIEVPEEGALLVVAWLRRCGELDRADELVRMLAPWFEALRFYPIPAESAFETKETVRLQDVATTLKTLDVQRHQRQLETMRDALLVWKPLRERAIALFAETVDGELPQRDGNGIKGGWPGARFAAGWRERVDRLVADRAKAGEPETKRGRETALLIDRLARCALDPKSVTTSEYHEIRRTIGRHIAAHGLHGTPARDGQLAEEEKAVAAPLHLDLRRVLVERLRAWPPGGGADLDQAFAAVAPDEASKFRVPAGSALPAYLAPKVARSCDASLEQLVEQGVIASGEVLARVLPQVTAQVRSEAIDDADARRLYTALYTAFRRRRGLLLLNYAHQVRFEELPWVAALEKARATNASATARARKAVASTSGIALRAFPYTIVPNKLVTELYSLTGAAELKLPLVEELAADIFMGAFTAKFVEAAKVSARLLAGTLYQRYYAIDIEEIARLPISKDKPSKEFAAVCERRAAPFDSKSRSGVARNGKIIEQAQILTTHNLAVLFDALPLRDQLAAQLVPIAETCFTWSTRRLQIRTSDWHQILINLKNAAYAWRQMVFYLSIGDGAAPFVDWAREQLGHADAEFRARFEPAMRGLELAVSGIASDDPAFARDGGRVFTGWSTDRHWLAPASTSA
jgi:hypothetical protein